MSARRTAQYCITSGLAGCYMPNTVYAYEFTRRRDLVAHILYELDALDFPKSCIKQVRILDLWNQIVRNGASSMHFRITHGDYELAFSGLTEAEFEIANSLSE